MKWALAQLDRYNLKPLYFKASYDFSNNIKDIDDILDLSIVEVEGYARHIHDERYEFKFNIKALMKLECAITLDPVDFNIDLNVTEIFDRNDDGDTNLIIGNTIDLEPIVWEIVYLEKPIRITKFDR